MNISFLGVFSIIIIFTSSIQAEQVSTRGVTELQRCRAVNECIRRLDNGESDCALIPIPSDALLKPISPASFELLSLRRHVWLFTDQSWYLSLIVLVHKRLVMVDIPDELLRTMENGNRTSLTGAAEKVLEGTVPTTIDIIYSHSHLDHIGGTTRFVRFMQAKYPNTKISIWGTVEARELVKASTTDRALLPTNIIGGRGRRLVLGEGLELQMRIIGGHTTKDLVISIPRVEKEPSIAMYVDAVFPGYVPSIDLAITVNVRRFIEAQENILAMGFDILVGGHFRPGTEEDMKLNVQYTKDLIEAARSGVEKAGLNEFEERGLSKLGDPMAREFNNQWFGLFRIIRPAQIAICYRIMLEKYGCKLSGIDVTGPGHCQTAILFLLTDE